MLPPINATSIPDRHINLQTTDNKLNSKKVLWNVRLLVCGPLPPVNAGSLYLEVRKYSMPGLIRDHLKIQY